MTRNSRLRMLWHRQVHQWHWISAAITLAALLLFSVTGITLNHAGSIGATPRIERGVAELPPAALAALAAGPASGSAPLPGPLRDFVAGEFALRPGDKAAEWSADEVYLALPAPGADAWVAIDRADGTAEYERSDRGWIAFANDLHKGRNTGVAWQLFIDVFAVACLVFAVTGLFLLQLQARARRATWPLVGGGLALVVVLAAFLLH